MRINRRDLVLAAAAVGVLSGCSGGSKAPSTADMALGPENAPVTVIEYASTACGHCADFHKDIFPKLKDNYIDAGKIRFIYREYPTGNPELATAGALLARCIGTTPDRYFGAIDALFAQQGAIFQAAAQGQARQKLLEIAQAGGLSEDAFKQCLTDEAQITRLTEVAEFGNKEFKITGTPTVIVNGKVIENTVGNPYTYEKIAKAIDEAS